MDRGTDPRLVSVAAHRRLTAAPQEALGGASRHGLVVNVLWMPRLGEEESALSQEAGHLRGKCQQPGQATAEPETHAQTSNSIGKPNASNWNPTLVSRITRAVPQRKNSHVLNEPPGHFMDFCTSRGTWTPVAVSVVGLGFNVHCVATTARGVSQANLVAASSHAATAPANPA